MMITKKMETDEKIRGKAFIHWCSWHEAYKGIVSEAYLDALTLEKCKALAFRWAESIMVAIDEGRVIGFVGYGVRGDETPPDIGEIFALYVLSDYYGTGVGLQLVEAGLEQLKDCSKISLWVLKKNHRRLVMRLYTERPRNGELQHSCCRDQNGSESLTCTDQVRMKMKNSTANTGGAYKIEASIVVTVLNTILMLVFYVRCRNKVHIKG